MEKYILTGGPSCGKSSLIIGLQMRGEEVVSECAEDVIRYNKAKGILEPWKNPGLFQAQIFNLQKIKENYISGKSGRVFYDRSYPDQLDYATQLGCDLPLGFYSKLDGFQRSKVFILDHLNIVAEEDYRREDLSEALELQEKHKVTYKTLGFNIVNVPVLPLEERVDYILGRL